MSTEIESCTEADLPGLFELFKEVYPYNPNLPNRKYFDWQFKDTPFSKKEGYQFFLFRESGTIKAFVGCLPMEYRLDGKVESGCWVYNWHTFGQGLYGFRLWEFLKENYGNFLYALFKNIAVTNTCVIIQPAKRNFTVAIDHEGRPRQYARMKNIGKMRHMPFPIMLIGPIMQLLHINTVMGFTVGFPIFLKNFYLFLPFGRIGILT